MELSPWRYKSVPIMALIFLLATGCTSPVPEIGDLTSTANGRTPTNPIVKTEQPGTPTHRVVPTLAPTIMVSNVTPTVTRPLSTTQLLQWTPGAKLPPDEAEKKIMKFYSNNGGCELPCWWGITPGETTGAETLSLLAPLGDVFIWERENGIMDYHFQFVVPKTIEPVTGYFWPTISVINDVVAAININTRWVMRDFDYSLSGLLKSLGPPDEIRLEIYPKSMSGTPHFEMDLFYPTKGFDVGINENATYEGNLVRICPQDIFNATQFPPGMLLWSSEERLGFVDLPIYLPDLDVSDYRLLEELTDEIDTKLFFETYRNPKTTKCFRIPLDRIPGYVTPYP